MNCAAAARLEPLYTTGDLDSKSMAELDLHVSQCPACAIRWKQREQVDGLLRDAVLAEQVDACAVVERVRQQMQGSQRRPNSLGHRLLIAVCSLVIFLAVAGIALIWKSSRHTLYAYAVQDHIAEVVDRAPRPWIKGPANIEQMVRQHLAVSGLVQTLTPDGYHIERAMVCPLSDQRYTHLVYSNGAREVSFFVGQKGGRELPGKAVEHANNFPVHVARVENMQVAGLQTRQFTIMVVGSLPKEKAVRFLTPAASVE